MMGVDCPSVDAANVGRERSGRKSVAVQRFLLAISLVFGAAAQARAFDSSSQVWLVSTRSAPHCGDLDAALQSLRYCRLDENCQWSPAEADAFHASNDVATPTIVFIHGNRTDSDEAVTKACFAYDCIRAASGNRPCRFVIWSWPAERAYRRNKSDVRLKVAYSDDESYYLAQWLAGLQPGVKVSLIGHSFGPRIITGALHLLAGGEVAGRRLPEDTAAEWKEGKRNPIRAVLLAAGLDVDWLAPGGCHGLALSLVDRMLITRNGCDRVLRWYPRMYGRGGPQAIGFVGPSGLADPEKVEVLDVGCTVGKFHDWRCYCSAANVCSRWAQYTFLDETPTHEVP